MAKLPVKVKEKLVVVNNERIPHYANIIRRKKANDPSLPHWWEEKPVAYYEGLLHGAYTYIEDMLFAYNCYKGFSENKEGVRDYNF